MRHRSWSASYLCCEAKVTVKWGLVAIAMVAAIPFSGWLRRNPSMHAVIWTLFGFLAVQHGPLGLYMAPISWATWPGFVKGVELSLLDILTFAIYLSLPPATQRYPFRAVTALYMAAVVLAALQAQFIEPALFYAWQLARVLFVALVVSRAVSLRSAPPQLYCKAWPMA